MAIKARIFWDVNAQAYVVSTAYNEKAVDALKSLIPSGDRSWDSSSKLWYVKEPYGEALRSLFGSAFGIHAVSFTSKQVAEQSQQQSHARTTSSAGTALNPSVGTTEDAIVAFFGLLSYDAAKQSYRRAAQDLHPDKQNGDASRMSRLNDLWARIEKEYFKR
jgi:hypothetical protein